VSLPVLGSRTLASGAGNRRKHLALRNGLRVGVLALMTVTSSLTVSSAAATTSPSNPSLLASPEANPSTTAFTPTPDLLPTPLAPLPARTLSRLHPTRNGDVHGNSLNWAGYVAGPGPGPFRTVWAKWNQPPPLTCGTSEYTAASFWVGMDGGKANDPNNTGLEQTGVDTVCDHGTLHYRPWVELYRRTPSGICDWQEFCYQTEYLVAPHGTGVRLPVTSLAAGPAWAGGHGASE